MRSRLKRVLGITLAVALIAVFPCSQILARTHIETDKECSIAVDVPDSWSDLKSADFSVDLYRVASVDENGGYEALSAFDEISEDIEAIGSGTTADDWEQIAQKAAELAKTNNISADKSIAVSNGVGKVFGVATGLYLVDTKDVTTTGYGYTFSPYMVAAPNNEYAVTGSGDDNWVYDDISIELKPEQTQLVGSLRINKTLTTYNTELGNPLFAFDVEAYDADGNVIFSDIASIRFDGAGTQSAVIENIPAGARVVVTEVYSAGSYQVTSSDNIETTIVANDTVDVDFTNDYSDKLIYSTGVVNHFEYDGTGWEWVKE